MSVKIMARVWAHSQRKDGELLVMLALADFANDAGECWPSIPILATKARLTERQTRKVLTKLEEAGEIRRVRSNGGRNRRNHYFINLSENPEIKTLKKEQGNKNPVFGDTKTLSPATGALNHHRTVKSVRATKRATTGDSDSRIKSLIDRWFELYQQRFSERYVVAGKDAALIKVLLAAYSEPTIAAYMESFFKTTDSWVREHGGYTIGVFYSQFNKLVSTAKARPPQTAKEMPL